MSVSIESTPRTTAASKAASVFSGATSGSPRCPPIRSPTSRAAQSTSALLSRDCGRLGGDPCVLDAKPCLGVEEVPVGRLRRETDLVALADSGAFLRIEQGEQAAAGRFDMKQHVAPQCLAQDDGASHAAG